ncbi:hypothetical protein ABIB15_002611, partial [Marisediminicola sp. UYEF4]
MEVKRREELVEVKRGVGPDGAELAGRRADAPEKEKAPKRGNTEAEAGGAGGGGGGRGGA